jgi:hypothetical protein
MRGDTSSYQQMDIANKDKDRIKRDALISGGINICRYLTFD